MVIRFLRWWMGLGPNQTLVSRSDPRAQLADAAMYFGRPCYRDTNGHIHVIF